MSHGLIDLLDDPLEKEKKEMSNDRFGLESDKESESIFSLFSTLQGPPPTKTSVKASEKPPSPPII